MIKLVTGTASEVYPRDDALRQLSLLGDCTVLEYGSQMAATIPNANTVRVADGIAIIGGAQLMIEKNTFEDFTIETGTAGVERYDLIGFTVTESGATKTVKKNAGAGDGATGDFWSGGTIFRALYRVHVSGITIASVEQLFTVHGRKEETTTKENYFDTERIIGDYVEGILYEKTIRRPATAFVASSGYAAVEIDTGIRSAQHIEIVDAHFEASYGELFPIPKPHFSTGAITTYIQSVRMDTGKIGFRNNYNWASYTLVVTLRYLKKE